MNYRNDYAETYTSPQSLIRSEKIGMLEHLTYNSGGPDLDQLQRNDLIGEQCNA
jgi:hypothetical protein